MSYVDGFVVPVPHTQKAAYRAVAATAAQVFMDHGALAVVEAWGDDVPPGKATSFPLAVRAQPDETVVFSWIRWPSRAARDDGMAKSMADPRMTMDPAGMPFDTQRMIFGGFEVIVDAQ